MKIIMVWGQRKNEYAGQYAPELLTAIDEVGDEHNPDFINSEYKKAVFGGEFDAVRIIITQVYTPDLTHLLSLGSVSNSGLEGV
jgi:hypothetical protein